MESPRIILPNEIEIEFRLAHLPEGGYGVTCTECFNNPHAKQHTWRFPHMVTVLAFQKTHRAEHFGILKKS